jgi:hypothetical protein
MKTRISVLAVAGALGLALGSAAPAGANSPAHVWLNQGPPAYAGYRANVHLDFSPASQVVAIVKNGATVFLECWHDGGWANLNYSTNRWFEVTVPNGAEPITGWLTASAIRKSEQPRLPRCIWVVHQLGNGTSYGDWQSPEPAPAASPPAPAASAPAPAPAASAPVPMSAPVPGPSPAPARTYPETTGSVAHTWTDYADAGGYEGSLISANATVEIACAVIGFRVADGNTWWYRIAQAPWNGAYYVSADAFYNDGAISGSLLGTPFVDPAVPSC